MAGMAEGDWPLYFNREDNTKCPCQSSTTVVRAFTTIPLKLNGAPMLGDSEHTVFIDDRFYLYSFYLNDRPCRFDLASKIIDEECCPCLG